MCSLTDDLDFEAGVPSDFKQTSKYQRGVDRNEKPQMQLVSSYLSLVLGHFSVDTLCLQFRGFHS